MKRFWQYKRKKNVYYILELEIIAQNHGPKQHRKDVHEMKCSEKNKIKNQTIFFKQNFLCN